VDGGVVVVVVLVVVVVVEGRVCGLVIYCVVDIVVGVVGCVVDDCSSQEPISNSNILLLILINCSNNKKFLFLY